MAGRKQLVSNSLIRQRIEYSVGLKKTGLPSMAILRKINKMSTAKGWGQIGERQLKKDMAKYYNETSVFDLDEKSYLNAIRDMHLSSMERDMFKLQMEIETKKTWKPFERDKAIKNIFDMKYKFAILQGWDHSRRTSDSQSCSFPKMADIASKEMMDAPQETRDELIRVIDSCFGSVPIDKDGMFEKTALAEAKKKIFRMIDDAGQQADFGMPE